MKKIFKVSVAVLLMLTYCSVFVSAFAYSAITEETIDSYLSEQGVPEIAIQKIPFELKKQVFLDNSKLDVGEPTYGVFTDKYKVEYKLENGQVVMDSQSREELHKLMSDEKELASIMISKKEVTSQRDKDILPNAKTENELLAERKEEVNAYLEENPDEIKSLQKMSAETFVISQENWEATMVCVHLSYEGGYAKKMFLYAWDWNYLTTFCLTDNVGMAWSNEFVNNGGSDDFAWLYQGHSPFSPEDKYYEAAGNNYTSYDKSSGIGTEIDIKFYDNAGKRIYRHCGLIMALAEKITYTNEKASAVGCYFHKRVALSVNASLTFSGKGLGGSIGIIPNWAFDKSADSGVGFETIKG